jgi:hypothetical protein
MKKSLRALVVAAPIILAFPAFAADPDDADVESQWSAPVPGAAEGEYANPDRRLMNEERSRSAMGKLCSKLRLRADLGIGGGSFPRAKLGVRRRMEIDLDNSLALIDEEILKLSWGIGEAFPLGGGAAGELHFGAGVSGKSMVVRRLGTFDSCAEVDRLLDLSDVKVVLPVTAARIAAMGKGELWRMPLTVNVGHGGSVGLPVGPSVTITLGYGKDKDGMSSMTLWRLSEHEARFRFRVDTVQVYSKSLGVTVTAQPLDFSINGANLLARFLDKEIAKELHRYTAAYAGLGAARSEGKRMVLEYTIDPTDPAQAEAMAQALRGNFLALLDYARRMGTSLTASSEIAQAYDDLQRANGRLLGDSSYAAKSDYWARVKSLSVNIPVLVDQISSESFGGDTVTQLTGEGGRIVFGSAGENISGKYYRLPLLGSAIIDLESRNVDVIVRARNGKPRTDPVVVYYQNNNFQRLPASRVDMMVEDANSILRLAGAARRGGGEDPSLEIPIKPSVPVPQLAGGTGLPETPEPSDQKGWASFTLVMNERAVRAALSASAEEVIRAFARSVPAADRALAGWLAHNGRLAGGRIVYDAARAKADLRLMEHEDSLSWLASLAQEAAGLTQDLAEAARTSTPEQRELAVAKIFSHENRSGLSSADVLRVLVQFMDPLDLTGDFVAASKGMKKGSLDIKGHHQLKRGRAEVPLLGLAGQTRTRFREGILTD